MSITKDILKLIRIEQWYKNFLIFIPLVFSLNFFNIRLLFITFLGFISLSLISSSYYIINDLKDIQKDKHHPEKKNRPLASGRLSRTTGILILILFLINSITLSYYLSPSFLVVVLVLFLSSQIYSFFLREFAGNLT